MTLKPENPGPGHAASSRDEDLAMLKAAQAQREHAALNALGDYDPALNAALIVLLAKLPPLPEAFPPGTVATALAGALAAARGADRTLERSRQAEEAGREKARKQGDAMLRRLPLAAVLRSLGFREQRNGWMSQAPGGEAHHVTTDANGRFFDHRRGRGGSNAFDLVMVATGRTFEEARTLLAVIAQDLTTGATEAPATPVPAG